MDFYGLFQDYIVDFCGLSPQDLLLFKELLSPTQTIKSQVLKLCQYCHCVMTVLSNYIFI